MRTIMDHVYVRAQCMPGATDLERAKAAALAMDHEVNKSGRSFKMWAENLKAGTGREGGRPRTRKS